MILQSFRVFGRAPGFSNKSINVRSKTCTSVVDHKERIKVDLLEFALARNSGALAFESEMLPTGKSFSNVPWVSLMLIGLDLDLRNSKTSELLEQFK